MRVFSKLLIGLALVGCGQPQQRVLFVQPAEDGEWDDPGAAREGAMFTTISAAITASSSGDLILVPSGTYVEDLTMKDGVSVNGAGQDETYLVGTVTFTALTTGATLSSMTMVDSGYVSTGVSYNEDGISVFGGNATIDDVRLHRFYYGLYADSASTVVVNGATVTRNWYGLVADDVSDLTISNSFIASNAVGGISTDLGTGGSIVHNTVIGNGFAGTTSYLSGGIALGSSGTEIVANNIITSNYYGLDCNSCGSSWSTNLVWGNSTDYVNDASSASSDLSSDPLFKNASEGDYSLDAASPCVDAGTSLYTVAEDADGETRPQGLDVDVGMDEYASSDFQLVITEVLANAKVETEGEFVEIHNAGSTSVDLAGFILTDGDDVDVLQAYDGGSTVLPAGAYAVVLDPNYADSYSISASAVLMTTGDTNVGNGLTTSDSVTLFETDGSTIVATFSYPKDPGDSISMEMYNVENGDAAGNWKKSQCASGRSPGSVHCFPESGDPVDLIITEVLANAYDESTGEFVELYNPTDSPIDAAGLILRDGGGSSDVLESYQSGSTLIAPKAHALIIDSGYAYDYVLPSTTVLLTTGDASLGNGLSIADSVTVYLGDGTTVVDTFSYPSDPGDDVSIEKVDYAVGDTSANWAANSCGTQSTPGRLNAQTGGLCTMLNITEVMSNPLDEDTGEYIELLNVGADSIDLAGLQISDGTQVDTLGAMGSGATLLGPGEYAVIVDAEYALEYSIPADAVVVTTLDTHLGNGLSVKDEVFLFDATGVDIVDAFLYPMNPGNGISVERKSNVILDGPDNWVASTCALGASPGDDNCVTVTIGESSSTVSLVITEVMSNPLDESTGEFVEVYNSGTTDIDLLYYVLYDGDAADTIVGYDSFYDTVLGPGEYAVIIDDDFDGDYTFPSGVLVLTSDDANLGSGLATNDEVYLYEDDGSSLIDSYTHPFNAGNGISVEKIDMDDGDVSSNWVKSTCTTGSSPGETNCAS